jgi:hypothetical protein
MSKPERRLVACKDIRTDGGTQHRAYTDAATITEYKEAMEGGAEFPPIDLVYDEKNDSLWLTDGFHRLIANVELGKKKIEALIYKGTQRDAILRAAGANSTHGRPRSQADKRRSVTMLLEDKEWRDRSMIWLAQAASVSPRLVRDMLTERKVVRKGVVRKDGRVIRKANANRGKLLPNAKPQIPSAPGPNGQQADSQQENYDMILRRLNRCTLVILTKLKAEIEERITYEEGERNVGATP